MRRKLLVLLAVIVVLAVVVAAPVSAKKPLRGDQEMFLNVVPGTFPGVFLYGCGDELMSWFGEIIIGDTTYGMALYLVETEDGDAYEGRLTGNGKVNHYVEDWAIWSEPFELNGGVIADCEPGDRLLYGTDEGLWTLKTLKFRSNGTVLDADEDGEFGEWLGRRVHQDGVTPEGVFEVFDIAEEEIVELEGIVLIGDLRLN